MTTDEMRAYIDRLIVPQGGYSGSVVGPLLHGIVDALGSSAPTPVLPDPPGKGVGIVLTDGTEIDINSRVWDTLEVSPDDVQGVFFDFSKLGGASRKVLIKRETVANAFFSNGKVPPPDGYFTDILLNKALQHTKDGEADTDLLAAAGFNANEWAVHKAKKAGGYLPSVFEITKIMQHAPLVNTALEKAGAEPLSASAKYWTSTGNAVNDRGNLNSVWIWDGDIQQGNGANVQGYFLTLPLIPLGGEAPDRQELEEKVDALDKEVGALQSELSATAAKVPVTLEIGDSEAVKSANLAKLQAVGSQTFVAQIDYGFGTGTWTAGKGGSATVTTAQGVSVEYTIVEDGTVAKRTEYGTPAYSYVSLADITDGAEGYFSIEGGVPFEDWAYFYSRMTIYVRVGSTEYEVVKYTHDSVDVTISFYDGGERIDVTLRNDGTYMASRTDNAPLVITLSAGIADGAAGTFTARLPIEQWAAAGDGGSSHVVVYDEGTETEYPAVIYLRGRSLPAVWVMKTDALYNVTFMAAGSTYNASLVWNAPA